MPGTPFVTGDRVTLCTIEEDRDYEFLRDQLNRPAIRRPTGLWLPTSREDVEEFVDSNPDEVVLLVCTEETPVGMVNIRNIDRISGTGELGLWIATEYQGNGYGTEAAALMVEYGFDDLALRRIEADVLSTNEPVVALVESLGFTHEGTSRAQKFVEGEYHDVERYGLLADEWE